LCLLKPIIMLLQKLNKGVQTNMELAQKYYAILSAINDLGLTTREIQLIAFTAIRGNITHANIREEFCNTYDTTSPTINNIISKLKKKGIFVKSVSKGEEYPNKVKVNPKIVMDFSKDIVLQIVMNHGE